MNKNIAIGILVCLIAGIGYMGYASMKGSTMKNKDTAVQTPVAASSTPKPAATDMPTAAPTEADVKGASDAVFDPAKSYVATLHTEKGDITVAFSKGQTPKTVGNFVTLAKKNFYNGTIFHRTIKGFMIQGGDPQGTGRGGPGYTFEDEPFTGEYTRGTIAMANAGPNTNGSQFFIMHADYPLPKNYTIFGKVTKGIEVVDAIATAPTLMSGEGSTPANPVKITSVDIQEGN
jgi:cyclophilin family peptidyl-prolyl cis-trans isomerase